MTFLFAGFMAVWLLVTLYLVYMGQRQRSLEQELRTLQEMVQDQRKRA